MKISVSEKYLPVYEALASDIRIKIINILAVKSMNIKDIAVHLGLSSAIISMHVKKLEKAGLVRSERIQSSRSNFKVCHLNEESIEIEFPKKGKRDMLLHEFVLPVGHYTDFNVEPTCGLATEEKLIGYYDDPRYFLDPERVNAKILWFTKGFVEYKVPNYLLSSEEPIALEISMELGSEAPGVNSNWPSDISFFINGVNIGQWISPGDFGERRGNFTPEWWSLSVGQFGLLKVLRIDDTGSYMDGEKISDITCSQLKLRQKQWSFRIAVLENAVHPGGVTVFGAGFGNYDQDIIFRLYYV